MTPAEFRTKWSKIQLGELQAYQAHFLDLCSLVGHPSPEVADPTGESFCFQRGAAKQDGGEGWADAWKRGHFGFEYKGKGRDLDAAYRQLLQYREALENPPLLIVSDLDRILVRTNFTGTRTVLHEIRLETIADPTSLEVLRAAFFEPERLRPGAVSALVTREAAQRLGALAHDLARRGIPPPTVARFLDRLVFCFFAEDVGILPDRLVSRLLEQVRSAPEEFPTLSADLFEKMSAGGRFGLLRIPHVNGSLFDNADTLPLSAAELGALYQVSQLDWSHIDPSIFGTLFERGLDPAKRSQLGAHYTSREDIETLVEPVVMTPLRREWAETMAAVRRLMTTGGKVGGPEPVKALSAAAAKKARLEAAQLLERFLQRLESVKVLDPACGSGNFLYVTLWKLKELESEVYDFLLEQGLQAPLRLGVGPWQLYGIELNQYAHELAQMTVWIGYLQWLRQHGTTTWKEPILQAMSNIENKDAVLDLTDPAHPREPTWPKVDFIVSNPPFLGGKKIRGECGHDYFEKLTAVYAGRLPRFSDLCCYWFEKTRSSIEERRSVRAGLLATQGIRGGASRQVLARIKNTGDIFWAISDRDWVLDGANVHVSMVGFDDGSEATRELDGRNVRTIHANLSAGADIARARRLEANARLGFIGIQKSGSFEVTEEVALRLLRSPNPHDRPNSDVLRPFLNAADVTGRSAGLWIIDFDELEAERAALYAQPFAHVVAEVKPVRDAIRRDRHRLEWWRFGETRQGFRAASRNLASYLAVPMTAKHHLVVRLGGVFLPSNALVAFTSSDDTLFGILSASAHQTWARALGTQLREKESGSRYTPSTAFETFPFPSMDASRSAAIAGAARELDELRQRWLNPPEWMKEEVLEFPGAVDGPWGRFVVAPNADGIGTVRWSRTVAKDAEHEKKLARRTLTNLYNERPAWLANAHQALDEAVFAAYGWPGGLPDEEILERLLALNLAEGSS